MKARDVDLGTLWEGVAYRYEEAGRPLPWRWRITHRVMHALLRRGSL